MCVIDLLPYNMSSPVERRVECDLLAAPVKCSSAARAEVSAPTDPANDESDSVSEQTEERGAVERSTDPPSYSPVERSTGCTRKKTPLTFSDADRK